MIVRRIAVLKRALDEMERRGDREHFAEAIAVTPQMSLRQQDLVLMYIVNKHTSFCSVGPDNKSDIRTDAGAHELTHAHKCCMYCSIML